MDYKKKYLKYKSKYIELKKYGWANIQSQVIQSSKTLTYPIRDELFSKYPELIDKVKSFISNISKNKNKSSQILGEGGFGIVYKFNFNNNYYALKQIKKNNNKNLYDFKNEISILKILKNIPSMLQYEGSYININIRTSVFDLYLLTAYKNFPSLYDLLLKPLEYFTNNIIENNNIKKEIFINFYKAIKTLHEKNIIHMDIKLENILVDLKTKDVILIDFGAACNCSGDCEGDDNNIDKMIIEKRIIKCFRNNFGNSTITSDFVDFRIKEMINDKDTSEKIELLKQNDLWAFGISIYELYTMRNFVNNNLSFYEIYTSLNNKSSKNYLFSYIKMIEIKENFEIINKYLDDSLDDSKIPTMEVLLPFNREKKLKL